MVGVVEHPIPFGQGDDLTSLQSHLHLFSSRLINLIEVTSVSFHLAQIDSALCRSPVEHLTLAAPRLAACTLRRIKCWCQEAGFLT